MGDFVDRGFYSVETFLLLLALKVYQNIKQYRLNYFKYLYNEHFFKKERFTFLIYINMNFNLVLLNKNC